MLHALFAGRERRASRAFLHSSRESLERDFDRDKYAGTADISKVSLMTNAR